MNAARFTHAEQAAIAANKAAIEALSKAIEAYQAAGFGSFVIQPLRDALELIAFSSEAVQS